MALTGLMLSGFLIAHLSGNLLLFLPDNGVTFNQYAEFLEHQFWIVPAELALLAVFLLHVALAWTVTVQNRKARQNGYAYKNPSEASLGSRTMFLSGGLVFVFIIVHLLDFKFADHHSTPLELYGVVLAKLSNPFYSLFYIICMVVFSLHLIHGIQSAFQTFGLNHRAHTPWIKKLCILLALGLGAGYVSIPLWLMITKGGY